MRHTMRISWKSILLAPLVIPVLYSAAIPFLEESRNPAAAFLIFFVLGSVFSCGATVFVLLPGLFVVSRFTPLTPWLTGLVGTVLGGRLYLPVVWQSYLSSGDNSGPPPGTFVQYLRRSGCGTDLLAFLAAGLVTALLYWFLSRQPTQRNAEPTA